MAIQPSPQALLLVDTYARGEGMGGMGLGVENERRGWKGVGAVSFAVPISAALIPAWRWPPRPPRPRVDGAVAALWQPCGSPAGAGSDV